MMLQNLMRLKTLILSQARQIMQSERLLNLQNWLHLNCKLRQLRGLELLVVLNTSQDQFLWRMRRFKPKIYSNWNRLITPRDGLTRRRLSPLINHIWLHPSRRGIKFRQKRAPQPTWTCRSHLDSFSKDSRQFSAAWGVAANQLRAQFCNNHMSRITGWPIWFRRRSSDYYNLFSDC